MAGTTSSHSLWFKIFGADKAAAKNKKVAQSVNRLQMAVRQLKAGMLGMSGMMTGAAASMVVMGLALRRTVTEYDRYTLAQSRLRTALAANTDEGARNARLFAGPLAESVGRDFGYSLAEANDAMGTMIQTGIGVHASMRVFRSSMRLARIADMDTAQATRFLVDTMNMFRREMRQGDGTMRGFADRMSGQLAVAAYSTSTNIEDLQQAFRYAGTELSGLGYNSQQVMSALAGLSVVGLRSTTAGTRLRGAMMAMHRTTGPLTALLREHGIQSEEIGQAWYDNAGNIRPFYEGLENMSELIRRVDNQQDRNAIQMHLFGRRAFAAGQFVTGMSQAAARARRAFETMGDEGQHVGVVLERMERERMQSFSMQMTQLKEGISDLAIGFGTILFGEMQQGERGFGTYIRQVSEGVMLIGELSNRNAVSTERWKELSPEVQQAARELRAFFTDLATGLRFMGRVISFMGRFTRRYPYVVAGLIAVRIAFGGLGNAALFAGRRLMAANTMVAGIPRSFTRAGIGARMVSGGLATIGIAIMNEVSPAIQNMALELGGVESSMAQVRSEIGSTRSAAVAAFPIVGNLVASVMDLINAIRTAFRVSSQNRERRRRTEREVTRATGIQRMRVRQAQMSGQERYRGMASQDVNRAAVTAEQNESGRRAAAMMYRDEIRGRSLVMRYLRQTGLAGERLVNATNSVIEIQERYGSTLNSEAEVMVGDEVNRHAATRDAIAQFGQLSQILANINASAPAAPGSMAGMPGYGVLAPGAGIPFAMDGYVNRGGIMGVSSGDLIVSRNHLADAVTASRGAMVGPALGMGSGDGMVGPSPTTTGGGGGDVVVPMSVSIDGREVARAVGRASIQQRERGGGNIAPGERRSLRETGFGRSV